MLIYQLSIGVLLALNGYWLNTTEFWIWILIINTAAILQEKTYPAKI